MSCIDDAFFQKFHDEMNLEDGSSLKEQRNKIYKMVFEVLNHVLHIRLVSPEKTDAMVLELTRQVNIAIEREKSKILQKNVSERDKFQLREWEAACKFDFMRLITSYVYQK